MARLNDRIALRRTVQIDSLALTRDDWEAYEKPGVDDAVTRVNAVITKAVNAGLDRGAVYKAAWAAMQADEDFGFTDSEGLYTLTDVLDLVFGKVN